MKKLLAVILVFSLCLALAACGSDAGTNAEAPVSGTSDTEPAETGNQEQSAYPVTISNYDMETTYEAAPERIVSLSYSETEILVALGLGDRIVGIGEAENLVIDCLPEYQDEISGLNIIGASADGGVPSFETLLSVNPDFVYATSYALNAQYGVAELSDFQNNGINVYVSTGTYKTGCTIEDTYQDIRNIAAIFGVSDRAEEVISEMQSTVDDVAATASSAEEKPTVCAVSYCDASNLYVVGGLSIANSFIEAAGGENVYASEERATASVSWESLVEANPDYIIIFSNSGGVGSSDAQDKIDLLKSLPELANLDAVQNDMFIEIPYFTATFISVQNANAIEQMAQGIHPELY